jgi:hypothetical protein
MQRHAAATLIHPGQPTQSLLGCMGAARMHRLQEVPTAVAYTSETHLPPGLSAATASASLGLAVGTVCPEFNELPCGSSGQQDQLRTLTGQVVCCAGPGGQDLWLPGQS